MTAEQHAAFRGMISGSKNCRQLKGLVQGAPAVFAAMALLLFLLNSLFWGAAHMRLHKIPERNGVWLWLGFGSWISSSGRKRRGKTEFALQQRSELLDLVPDSIIVLNMHAEITFWNRGAESNYGWTRQEAVGRNCAELLRTRFPQPHEQIVQELLRDGQWSGELTHFTRSGAERVDASRWALQRDLRGSPEAVIEFNHDITERKRMEQALRRSEESFRLLFDVIPHPVFVHDAESQKIINVNRAATAIYGYTKDQFWLMKMPDLQVPDSIRRFVSRQEASAGVLALEGEEKHRAQDGHIVEVEVKRHIFELAGRKTVLAVVQEIGERKRAEAALRKSEESFRLLFGAVPQPLLVCDVRSKILELNQAAATVFGYSRDELLKMKASHLVAEPEAPRFEMEMRALNALNPRPDTFRCRKKDGQALDVEISLHRFELDGRRTTLALLQDITDRKRSQDELYQSRLMLRTILDNIPQRVFWKDRNLNYLGCNRTFALDAGLGDPAEIVGRSDYDMSWKSTADLHRGDDLQVIESEQAKLSFEEPMGRPDGSFYWLRTSKLPLRDRNGKTFGIIGTYEDITAKRVAEEALRKSEESFRLLFSVIPHPILVYDPETFRFLEVNDAVSATYGYSRKELQSMTVLDLLTPEEHARYLVEMESGNAFRPGLRRWKCKTKNGRRLTVEVGRHPFEREGRRAVLTISQDITQREEMEIDLRQRQKLEAVGSLAAGVAHEINTPIQFIGDNARFLQDAFRQLLGALMGCKRLEAAARAGPITNELLKEVESDNQKAGLDYLAEEVPKAIAESLDGVARVATIVRAMKDFAHPDLGELVNANLNEALKSTLIVARNELKYIADVEQDFGELPPVQCSVSDLNQVFLNLLINAAHAIKDLVKDSGAKGKIRVETRSQEGWVQITISDTGCGIPRSIQDKVFDPFFTTKPVGAGTGQGLAIARNIVVEKHKGTLSFTSEPGRGTTFYVRLPAVRPEAAESEEEDPGAARSMEASR